MESTPSNLPSKIQYALNPEVVYEVQLASDAQAFVITLDSPNKNTGIKTQVNRTLLPRFDPIGGMQGKLLQLKPEVLGFTLEIEYPHAKGADRYLLTFEHRGESPVLKKYRKEKLDLNGQVTGGIVADFDQMKARWLGPGIPTAPGATSHQGPRSALPPLALKQKPLLKLDDAISVFDYTVEVDVQTRN